MRLDLGYTRHQLAIFHGPGVRKFNSVAKGRRFGATHGAAHAAIEWTLEGSPVLWGDTITSNIAKYVDRYFLPALKVNRIPYRWQKSEKTLRIGPSGFVDFRSADKPQNWEGFGYRRVVLNEAGIILQNPELYSRTVLPMLLDFPESQLWALGVPKGMRLKSGQEHPFHALHKMAAASPDTHAAWTFSSYDNPLLKAADVADLEKEMAALDPMAVRQEIFGEFIDRVGDSPFAHAFEQARHVKPCSLARGLPVIASVDFNVDPFCAILCQVSGAGKMARFHTFAEIVVRGGGIREMADRIRALAPTHMLQLTGDRTGTARGLKTVGHGSLFDDLIRELRLAPRQVNLPANPSHIESREQCNYVLAHHPDTRIAPSCSGLVADLKTVEIDQRGHLVKADRTKASQRADLLDCWRYAVNAYLWDWIKRDRRTG